MQDLELIMKAQKGDESATEQLLIKYKYLVTQISRKYFLQGGELSDIAQEGMIGLYKAIIGFIHEKNIPFILFARMCIERQILTAIKKSANNKNAPLNDAVFGSSSHELDSTEREKMLFSIISNNETPESKIISDENTSDIIDSIKKNLSSFEWRVLELYLDGYTYIDISKMLDKTPKSIDNALSRIKNKLKFLRK